jgi:hypothetical protein
MLGRRFLVVVDRREVESSSQQSRLPIRPTDHSIDTYPIDGSVDGVASEDDSLWVLDATNAKLIRVDPANRYQKSPSSSGTNDPINTELRFCSVGSEARMIGLTTGQRERISRARRRRR